MAKIKKKNLSLSVPMPDGVEFGPGCTRGASLIVKGWFQAKPWTRRSVLLAAFAESGTCFDGWGDGTGNASPRLSMLVPVYTKSGPALLVLHHKAVGQEGSGSRGTERTWRTCGNGRKEQTVYNGWWMPNREPGLRKTRGQRLPPHTNTWSGRQGKSSGSPDKKAYWSRMYWTIFRCQTTYNVKRRSGDIAHCW
jgi:hypothetical protein